MKTITGKQVLQAHTNIWDGVIEKIKNKQFIIFDIEYLKESVVELLGYKRLLFTCMGCTIAKLERRYGYNGYGYLKCHNCPLNLHCMRENSPWTQLTTTHGLLKDGDVDSIIRLCEEIRDCGLREPHTEDTVFDISNDVEIPDVL